MTISAKNQVEIWLNSMNNKNQHNLNNLDASINTESANFVRSHSKRQRTENALFQTVWNSKRKSYPNMPKKPISASHADIPSN